MLDVAASTKSDAPDERVARWHQAIQAAQAEEKTWRDEACEAEAAYRSSKESKLKSFNLHHANIELLAATVYSSPPVPDIRTRFGEPNAAAKLAADMLERAISYTMDDDDDAFAEAATLAVIDMLNAGRGLIRVRYEPTVEGDGPMARLTDQRVRVEYVPWRRFVRGPGVTWAQVPWCAFEHYLDREEVARLLGPERADAIRDIPFTHSAATDDKDKRRDGEAVAEEFQRAKVFEVWDKRDKTVTFLCPDYKAGPIAEMPDPLGWRGFWPFPRPMQAVASHGSLTPVCPLTVYRDLIDQLGEVSRRITRLVKQLKPRGGYVGTGMDVKAMIEADDGEMVPLGGREAQLSTGAFNVNQLLTWFPIEPTVLAIRELMAQRESIKANIYEVTGIADIMRGASDPRETMGAQQIKAQFGSIRVRSRQAEVARFMRDLVRIKAHILATQFEPERLMSMTSIRLLPKVQRDMARQQAQANPQLAMQIAAEQPELVQAVQGPALEEVVGILRSDVMRSYVIDIETDSTIRGDMMRNQEQMSAFLAGTGQFMSAIGPAVREGAIPQQVAVEIYSAFARSFQLGKSVEDALAQLSKQASQSQPQGQGAQGQGVQGQADQQRAAVDAQAAQADAQLKALRLEFEKEREGLRAQIEEMKLSLKRYDIDTKDRREREIAGAKLQQQDRSAALAAMSKASAPAYPGPA